MKDFLCVRNQPREEVEMSSKTISSLLDKLVDEFENCRNYLFEEIGARSPIRRGLRTDMILPQDSDLLEKYKNAVKDCGMLILAEEDEPDCSTTNLGDYDYLLILDPLDGTINMLGNLRCGVNIAFGTIRKNHGDYLIGDLEAVFVADYLSKQSFRWSIGKVKNINPPKFDGRPFQTHDKIAAPIFELPDEYSYLEKDPDTYSAKQYRLHAVFRTLFRDYQRRAVDVTGLRLLDMLSGSIVAYGDFRWATRLWDTIPSIRFLLEYERDFAILDGKIDQYTLNTPLLRKLSNGFYESLDDTGREVVVIRERFKQDFKKLWNTATRSGTDVLSEQKVERHIGVVEREQLGKGSVEALDANRGLFTSEKAVLQITGTSKEIVEIIRSMSGISISESTIGILAQDEIQNIESLAITINHYFEKQQPELANALSSMATEAAKCSGFTSSQRSDLLHLLGELARQAALPEDERSRPTTIRAFLVATGVISAAGGIAEVWSQWGPQIAAAFGMLVK